MVYSIDPTKWTPVITWEKLFRSKQKNFLCMPQTHFWNRNHFVGWNQRPTFFLLLLGNPLSNRRKYDILYTDKLRGNLFSQKERPLPSFHDVRSDDEWCGVANFGRSNFFDLLTANQRILGIPLTSLESRPCCKHRGTILDDGWGPSQLGGDLRILGVDLEAGACNSWLPVLRKTRQQDLSKLKGRCDLFIFIFGGGSTVEY